MSRLSHLLTADADAIDPSAARRERKYSDREAYRLHRLNARRRGIPFELNFYEWLGWWHATGHYHERGSQRGQYVMARKGDTGPYAIGNIECMQAQENSVLPHVGRHKSNEWKEKLRNTLAQKRKEVSA